MTSYRCGTVCYLLFVILTINGAEVFSSLNSDNFWKQREIRSDTAPSSLPIGLANIRECTAYNDQLNCKTGLGNKCIRIKYSTDYGSVYQCICSEPDFIRIPEHDFTAETCQKCDEDIGSEIEIGKCVRKYCNLKQKHNCRTNIVGNTCTLVNDDYYKCECNATGYEERGSKCESSECSDNGKYNCKTNQGNKCILSYDRSNYVCICTEPAFIRKPPSSFRLESCEACNEDNGYGIEDDKCVRKFCNPEQRQNCRTYILGNRCILVNEKDYKCDCNATGYEERGKKCESSECSDNGNYNCKTNKGNKCILSYDRSKYVCICTEPAFIRKPPSTFRLETCEECIEDNGFEIDDAKCVRKYCDRDQRLNCGTAASGNTCTLVNGDNYKCECNARGYEEIRNKCTYM